MIKFNNRIIWPVYDAGEEESLKQVLQSRQWWRVGGQKTQQFEEEFSQYHHSAAGLALTNGTHALELALLTHDIKPGDEVIIPAFTFISTAMAVQHIGAIPIPVDINEHDYCIDTNAVTKAMTNKTKAIIPVHMAGHMVNMTELHNIAKKNNLIIIQDAAHAHGAVYKNKKIGDWNTTACFSFQSYKLMTAGEGGFITFPTAALYDKAFFIHNCGRNPKANNYEHLMVGSNYRISEFSSAILLQQLKRLHQQNTLRHENANYIRQQLSSTNEIVFQNIDQDMEVNPTYMLMFRVNTNMCQNFNRDKLVNTLKQRGIPAFGNYCTVYNTKAYWQKCHNHESHEHISKRCPISEKISAEGIWLHHSLLLQKRDMLDQVIEILKNAVHSTK